MFNHILVPLDGSKVAECVLPHLTALVQTGSPKVTLVHVLDIHETTNDQRPVDAFDWQIRKAESESYLKDVCSRLGAVGLNATDIILEGRAADSILEYAREQSIDLILLSSHGKSGISGWNVSSVVQKIIFRIRTSVMIVRAYKPRIIEPKELIYRRIMLPLDGSARAEVVLAPAEMLARSLGSELIAVTVIQRPELAQRMPSTEDTQLIERFIERGRAEAYAYLSELQTRMSARLETRLLVHDSEGTALHNVAEEEDVDLVILSAHGHNGETRWPYGSVAVSFISYGTTPLMIIQDLMPERIEFSKAEIAARELGRR